MAHRIETVEVNGSPMEVFIFEPRGAGPHPGIIVCQHIPIDHTGIENDRFTQSVADRYHPEAAEDAWQKALAFFAAKLKR